MDDIKVKIYFKNIMLNVLIAYFIVHPYSMIVFEHFERSAALPAAHSAPIMDMEKKAGQDSHAGIFHHFFHSFSLEMLPMSLSYAILGALIGFSLSRREYETILEKVRVEEANRELERLNKMKDEFLAVCSHDLKAPLNGVSMCMQLIESKVALSEIQKQFVETGIQNLTVMEKFIDEILHISKLESGKEILQLDKIEVNCIMQEIFQGMKDYSASLKIELIVNKPDEAVYFTADRLKFIRIFNNLISNAMKYARKNVEFDVQVQPYKLSFSVSDDGPGIPIEDQKRIFNKFEQAKSKKLLDLNNQGTGLGLAIVKNLVELHGGTIEVKSEIGSGTVFVVELPRK